MTLSEGFALDRPLRSLPQAASHYNDARDSEQRRVVRKGPPPPGNRHNVMKRYLFFVCHTYSFEVLRPMQAEIHRRGGEVRWFLHDVDPSYLAADEPWLPTIEDVQEYDPAVIYVPGQWVPNYFPGIKVHVFHGLANSRTGKLGHYRIRGWFDLYCTNSPETTQGFLREKVKYGTFHVIETGWPKVDPLFREGGVPSLRGELGTDKPIVLYASTFSPLLTSAPVLPGTIEVLSKDPQWFWLITLHPKMDPDVVKRYRAMESDNLRFVDSSMGVLSLLQTADVMLSDTSSIYIEFMLLDRPVVTFRTKFPGPMMIDCRQPEEIQPALARALTRPPVLMRQIREFADSLHPYRDGRSSERVIDAADELIEHHAAGLRPKPLNLLRKAKMRSWMRNYHRRA